jgi:predicted transcriptional regulator
MTEQSDKIFNHTKHWEFRKTVPKIDEHEKICIVVYSSKIDKEIIGEFEIGRVLHRSFSELMKATGYEKDKEAKKWFRAYYKNKLDCCAIEVLNPVRYITPITLENIRQKIPDFNPPQSFMYIRPNSDLENLVVKCQQG